MLCTKKKPTKNKPQCHLLTCKLLAIARSAGLLQELTDHQCPTISIGASPALYVPNNLFGIKEVSNPLGL